MKQPESFAEAVSPSSAKSPSKQKEKFEMIPLQFFPIHPLDKEFEDYEIKNLLNTIYTNRNYVDTDNS